MRNPDTTKRDYGHALLVAGSYGRMGCAILAARAALRSGCGLITVHLPSLCVSPMQAAFPEAMVSIDPDERLFSTPPDDVCRYDAIAVGPGIGTAPTTATALRHLLDKCSAQSPVVLDADALNVMAKYGDVVSHSLNVVATPHEGEYRRLFGTMDPAEAAHRYNMVLVCKSHRTRIYAPDGRYHENQTGNAAMATAGSGDVLTGILLGVLTHSQLSFFETVCRCVSLHGMLADRLVLQQSESSVIASDLVDELRSVCTDF